MKRLRNTSTALQGTFQFSTATTLGPLEAWRRVVDVSSHGEVVPLTQGSGPRPEDLHIGDRVVARTALGPLGFDDVMAVRELIPGERVVFEKVGRMLRGGVEVLVRCETQALDKREAKGSWVEWRQSFELPWLRLPRPIAGCVGQLVGWIMSRGYRRVVAQLLAS